MKFTLYVIIFLHIRYPFFVILKEIKPEKFEPEYAVPEDKPSKCAADQKTHYTGVYADIHVEENDHPLPRVSDDKKVIYSQPLFEKMDHPPNNDLSKPTRQVEVYILSTCIIQ